MLGNGTAVCASGAGEDAQDLRALVARIEAPPLAIDDDADEAQLEAAALELRRHCLALAHRQAHRQADPRLKSPCAGTVARLPSGSRVSLGFRGGGGTAAMIDLLQKALAAAAPDDFHRLAANREGVRAAEEAGLPAVAKRFADAIAIREEGEEEA